jgi:putative inorganic carbon (HCO3(-)) transporter
MPLNYPASLIPSIESTKSAIRQRLACLGRPDLIHLVGSVVGPIAVGLALGAILVFSKSLPPDWAGLVTLATLVPTIALLANHMSKLLLITLVVDIPLGLDIALGDRPHIGSVSGFLISLMTMALVVGYAIWLVTKSARGKSRVYTHKDMTIPALVYLFFVLLSTFQAVDVWFSFAQVFLQIQFVLMYFYVINHIRTWSDVRTVFLALTLCLLFEGILMLAQYLTGFQLAGLTIQSRATGSVITSATRRVAGTLGSPNSAATYVAASLAIAFAAYLTDGRLVNKKLALIAMLVGVLALMATQSRTGWGIFAVSMLILTVQAVRRHVGVKAILMLLIVALIIGAGFSEQIIERITADDRGSAESRVWYSKLAFNILEDHAFTGIGVNNLWLVMHDYLPLELLGLKRQYRHLIHNKYLLVWTETGLFGLLSFLWLLAAACRRAILSLRRASDPYTSIVMAGLLAALAVYLIHMLSDPIATRVRMQLFWFILALITATSRIARNSEGTRDPILQSGR